MKIIASLILGVCLFLFSIGTANAQYLGNTTETNETTMRCAPGQSQSRAFITSDMAVTGTINSAVQSTTDRQTRYTVDIDKHLKGYRNQEQILFTAQGLPGKIEKCNDIFFNKGDKVYLYLAKADDGTWTANPRSHVISEFCDDVQDPNSPVLQNMPKRSLVTSDFKLNHGSGYLEGKEIVYNFYALNPGIEKAHVTIAMNMTYGIDDTNTTKMFEFFKEFDLKPCNGHRIVEWSFPEPAVGKYHKKFVAEGSRDHTSGGWFKVYPYDSYQKLNPVAEDTETISAARNFDFVILGIERQRYEIADSISVEAFEKGLGCGILHLGLHSDSGKEIAHKSTDTCDAASLGIQINSENSDSIALDSGTYAIEAWFESEGDIVFSSERTFSITEDQILPLRQYKNGINFEDIQCDQNLVLIQKHDYLPACVTPQTKTILVERGWAKPSSEVTITITKRSANPESQTHLNPKEVTVVLGTNNTVTWINQDKTLSTIVSDTGDWSTGIIEPGQKKSITFNKTGTHNYHGQPQQWKTGSINIVAPQDMKTFRITSDDTDYDLLYNVAGAELYHAKKPNDAEMVIQLNNPVEGELRLAVPRGLMDSRLGSVDDTFLIIGGDSQIQYTESRNAHSRILTIELERWFDTIRIIGTDAKP